ncbi:sel1 repeat family protein [Butyrivibrio sp. CB08]|uniref:tetratricopeptide repeat protein n=1 Tax=Butyrivibrio sp. CB08 TaxID=2364879 RepID=UPI000EAA4C99|nr:tetratricopeptide repeat protein [Butyrivibrio sp. CB08]RKM56825.1 sel1 repeat family protein [Butyrivibrio sp. CB08]
MKDNPREVQIWQTIRGERPDDINDTGEELYYAGWQYEYGMNGCKDYGLALKAYEMSVSKGYLKAMTALGNIYLKTEDYDQAYKWYLEAAIASEDKEAVFNIALMYHDGDYLKQDRDKALRMFEHAYEMGCERASYYLGMYYENGIGVSIDQRKALEYYMVGADKYEEDCRDAVKRLKGDAYGNLRK